MRVIELQLQLAINRIISWTNKNGFNFSTDKTSCIYFCRLRGIHPDPEIFINHKQISIVDTSRFLGAYVWPETDFHPTYPELKEKMWQNIKYFKGFIKHNLGSRSHFYA